MSLTKLKTNSQLGTPLNRTASGSPNEQSRNHGTYRKLASPRKLNSKAHKVRVFVTKVEMQNLKREIRRLWNNKKVPKYFREKFVDQIFSLDRNVAWQIIGQEIHELGKGCAPVQIALSAVSMREKCLKNLIKIDKFLGSVEDTLYQKVFKEIVDNLVSLRMHSLHVIDWISQWKFQMSQNQIQKHLEVSVPFIHRQENYLIKMHTDWEFLQESNISKFFEFHGKVDPFLSTLKGWLYEDFESADKVLVPSVMLQKISLCKSVIKEELLVQANYVSPRHTQVLLQSPVEIVPLSEKWSSRSQARSSQQPKNEVSTVPIFQVIEEFISNLLVSEAYELHQDLTINQLITEYIEKETENLPELARKELQMDADIAFLELEQIFTYFATQEAFGICDDQIANDAFDEYLEILCLELASNACQIAQNKAEEVPEQLEENIGQSDEEDVTLSNIKANEALDAQTALKIREEILQELFKELDDIVRDEIICEHIWEQLITTELKNEARQEIKTLKGMVKSESVRLPDVVSLDDRSNDPVEYSIRRPITAEATLENQTPAEDMPSPNIDIDSLVHFISPLEITSIPADTLDIFPIAQPYNLALKLICHYLGRIQSEQSSMHEAFEEFMDRMHSSYDGQWYWIGNDQGVYGMLAFTIDAEKDKMVAIVQHLSVLSISNIQNVVKEVTKLIEENYEIQKILVDLHCDPSPDNDVIEQVIDAYRHTGYSHSALATTETYLVNLSYNVQQPQDYQPRFIINISGSQVIRLHEDPAGSSRSQDISDLVIESGMRYSMSQALGTLQDDHVNGTINRLQRDLHELVEIMQVQEDVDELEGSTVHIEDNVITSELQFVSNWKHGTYATHEGHQYVVFQGSQLVRSHASDGTPVYHLPTTNKDINYIIIKSHDFLSELRQQAKSHNCDLLYKVENLLRSLQPDTAKIDALWVPCFKKIISGSVPWLTGYPVYDTFNVSEWVETLKVEVSAGKAWPGNLLSQVVGDVITDEFIFIGVHEQIQEKLEIPLFACYINPSDWIN